MNAPTNPGEMSLALWRQLGRGDQARVIDAMMLEMGDHCPVPATADLPGDARWWVETSTQAAVSAFFVEICARMKPNDFTGMDPADKNNAFKTLWNGMDAATQSKALEYLQQNWKGQKAKPPS